MPGPWRRIAIGIGDPAGIGPDTALKACLDPRVTRLCRPLLVGDGDALARHAKACGLDAPIERYRAAAAVDWRGGGIKLLALEPSPNDEPAAARAAIQAALDGHVDAVVAAPRREAGSACDDDPSFVASCAGLAVEDCYLMWCCDGRRIVRMTPRWPLARAVALVTQERVLRAIEETQRALQRLGVAAPRIAVAGLNPHAGEGGLFGDEEIRAIGPALAAANAKGIRAEGPFGADTMLNRAGFDAAIVIYHDQGDVAAGVLAKNGVTRLTIGAPVLFCSVAQGGAGPEAVVAAVRVLAGPAWQKAA
jgi:4-hydroxy-L-threonine phosphate dehydrogenase PdxA